VGGDLVSRKLSGLRAWYVQRLSALYIVLYLLASLISLSLHGWPTTFAAWQMLWSYPLINLATVLFALALVMHAWVGIRDVLLDYVSIFALRLTLLTLFAVMLLISFLWFASVLFKVIN